MPYEDNPSLLKSTLDALTPGRFMRESFVTAERPPQRHAGPVSREKVTLGYALLFLVLGAAVAIVLAARPDEQASTLLPEGTYALEEAVDCLGRAGDQIVLSPSRPPERRLRVDGPGGADGVLRIRGATATGTTRCLDDSTVRLSLELEEVSEPPRIKGLLGRQPLELVRAQAAVVKRSGEETFGRLMLAIAAVLLAAKVVGAVIGRAGQPPVMGEVLAGILLGPTLLGWLLPNVKDYLFPADIVPLLTGASQIGLAFYMFLIGLELDPRLLRGRVGQAALISNASIVLPFSMGLVAAIPLFDFFDPPRDYEPFAVFMGVAMSITAFPVLARVLVERRLLKRPVGAMALACAAIDDVTAWTLLAFATALVGSGSGIHVLQVIGLAILFCIAMAFIARPLLGRLSSAYDEAGHIPVAWIGAIFTGVLVSAFVAQRIGIAAIFGAFVMGLIMPRRADLTHDLRTRVDSFVVTVLLPLFFVVTGLKTDVGSLDTAKLWLIALGLIGIAIFGKWVGAMAAARLTGFDLRESAALGALMNTRGLTELIVLNIALELDVITKPLFTMLVIMALVTTFMAAPALRLIDPRGILSAPPEEELREAVTVAGVAPERSILVAPLDAKNLEALLAVAVPLARSAPPRELILAELLRPPPSAIGLSAGERELRRAAAELEARRAALLGEGVPSRAAAFISADRGSDLVRLAAENEVDLVLVEGRRPLLGGEVPRGEVGTVLDKAVCDVAVLVERKGMPVVDADHPVVVPFGGAEHDWAALELGAWVAGVRGAAVRLVGTSGADDDRGDPSRALARAALAVQQLAGVSTQPVLVEPGREGLMRAAVDAGLLVVGLSDRWRQEGLGPLRLAIARTAPAPTIFVRRGQRPGALAPRDDMTRFTWSIVPAAAPR
jgi:Kef-type K+ transport system membrane component KefB